MFKLILADMDNTLVPSGQKHVSKRAIAAIHELLNLGVRFGPATGRDTFELANMFAGATECYQTGIVANGKRIYVDGELRRYALMENESLQRLVDYLSTAPNTFLTALSFDNPNGKEPYWCVGAREDDLAWFASWIGFTGRRCDRVPDIKLIASTIACGGTQEQLDDILRHAHVIAPCFDYVQPFEHWVDILPKGLDKGSALPMLLDEMRISPDEVLFFGDADNDLGIMGALDNTVAVANAMPAAAAAARWHIGESSDDAVAQALEDVAEAIRKGSEPRFMRR